MLSDVDPSGLRELSGPSQATGSHHKLAKLSTKAFIQKLLRLIYFIFFVWFKGPPSLEGCFD